MTNKITLHWTPPANERLNNLTAMIRHSSKTDGNATFANSTKIVNVNAAQNSVQVPFINGTYLLKLKDEVTKATSTTAIEVIVNSPDVATRLLVENKREDTDTSVTAPNLIADKIYQIVSLGTSPNVTDFTSVGAASNTVGVYFTATGVATGNGTAAPVFHGAKRDVVYNFSSDGLTLESDSDGSILPSGEYDFTDVIDLGGKYSVDLERTIFSAGLLPSDVIDSRQELVDSWDDWDGQSAEETSATVYFRASNEPKAADDILLEDAGHLLLEADDGGENTIIQELSVTFGEWAILTQNTFVGRTFQFKAELESEALDQTPLVSELGYKLFMPARVEFSATAAAPTISSGAGAKAVTFTNAFYETPTIGITAFDLATGDYYEVTSATKAGFTITFYNAAGNAQNRTFQYAASGVGSLQP